MNLLTAFLISILFGCGIYFLLQKKFVSILFGFILLNHSANLTVLLSSGDPTEKEAPIVENLMASYVDPLPQALILTAIVIGFAVTAYFLMLLYRIFVDQHTIHLSELFKDD